MNYFFYKLIAPRPTFAQDMTEEEAQILQVHAGYWKELADRRCALVVGPVLDPRESYGMAVVQLEDGQDPQDLGRNDPAILADKGFKFEVHLMPRLMLAPK